MTEQDIQELNECIRKFGESHKGRTGQEVLDECRGIEPLSRQYADICTAYRDALNKMWDTNGEWLGDRFTTFEVADCYIGNDEVRLCVDLNVSFDTFYEWYQYDLDIHSGIELGKEEARVVNLEHWVKGFPDNLKVPKETLDAWEKEYLEKLKS